MLSEVVASQQRSPLSLSSDMSVAACIVQTRLKTPVPPRVGRSWKYLSACKQDVIGMAQVHTPAVTVPKWQFATGCASHGPLPLRLHRL